MFERGNNTYNFRNFQKFATKERSWNFNLSIPYGFFKNVSSREKLKPCFFVNFNIIISYNFSENFTEIPQVIQKIWRFSQSIVTIFINFSSLPCYEGTNGVSMQQVISAFFTFKLPSIDCLTIVSRYIDFRLVLLEIWSEVEREWGWWSGVTRKNLLSKRLALLELNYTYPQLWSVFLEI